MNADRHGGLPLDPDLPDQPPLHLSPGAIGLVFVGGVAGTGCRYLTEETVRPWGSWPAATFLVNVVGAFLLGVLIEALARRGADAGWRLAWRLLAGTGFLGAFTTYSALAVEAVVLARDGLGWLGVGYAAGSVLAGFAACAVGIWAAGPRGRGVRA